MLWALGGIDLESLQGFFNIAWHGDGAGSFDIVPFDGETTVVAACSIFGDNVVLLEGISQVLGVLLFDIQDSKIVDCETKHDTVGLVFEQSWCCASW